MKKNIFLTLLLMFCLELYAKPDSSKVPIDEIVKRLGVIDSFGVKNELIVNGGKENGILLEKMEKSVDKAVVLLVNELKVIKSKRISPIDQGKYKEDVHVIWCIRALRYLTSINFTASTKHIFDKSEEPRKHFTSLRSRPKKYSFFGVWMSRDVIFVAPADVQTKIIEKWKRWLDKNQSKIKLKKLKDPDDWYF